MPEPEWKLSLEVVNLPALRDLHRALACPLGADGLTAAHPLEQTLEITRDLVDNLMQMTEVMVMLNHSACDGAGNRQVAEMTMGLTKQLPVIPARWPAWLVCCPYC